MAQKQTAWFRKSVLWIILFIIISAFCGLVYLSMQQVFRQSANDPQIQMAEDTAASLNDNKQLVINSHVDIAKSLAPFRIIYNESGDITSSEAMLDGQAPQLPAGVLDAAKKDGEKRFTWEPQSGVRIAAVVISYNDGFVLAGRSLREVEKREDQLGFQMGVGWIATIGSMTILIFFL